jgi:hypothetical protein
MANEPDRDSELWKALNSVGSSDDAYLIATAYAEKRVAAMQTHVDHWQSLALTQPRTHSDPIAALAHTNAELVKATERIRELEAEIDDALALAVRNREQAEAAQRKLAETPWEVRRNGELVARVRMKEPGGGVLYLRPDEITKHTIRNAVTGEEVEP